MSALMVGDTARNLRRVFFMTERLKSLGKNEDFKVRRVHVVGAGVMGGDIAAWCVLQGMDVTLQDRELRHIEPALKRARALFRKRLRKKPAVTAAMSRLRADVDGDGVPRADVIIEAIYEDADAKRALYATIEPRMAEHAVLATNTSALPLESLAQDPWWVHDLHNWMTTIVGGLAIAGMALGDAHPKSQYLIEYAWPLMEEFLKIYGPEGENNESVAYANATVRPVSFYSAQRYASGGGTQRMEEAPFPQTGRWLMYFTLPPGRVAAFGDARTDAKPWVKHLAAIAAASRDGILQSFYLNHATPDADPVELLWYDASLEPVDPQDNIPLGRAYHGHGGCVSSRTSWDAESTACVIYGKASREENHEHNRKQHSLLPYF